MKSAFHQGEKISEILDILEQRGSVTFQELFSAASVKEELIVTQSSSILEMAKLSPDPHYPAGAYRHYPAFLPMKEELRHIIEALLFVSDTPLSVRRIQEILDLRETFPVREALFELASITTHAKEDFIFAKWQADTSFAPDRNTGTGSDGCQQSKPARPSRASLETPAIIAYKQPVIRSGYRLYPGLTAGDSPHSAGAQSWIRIWAQRNSGRPMIYGTTQKFLEMFDLKDLKDLLPSKRLSVTAKRILSVSGKEHGRTEI
ncbi:MAG: SMC-Scp complex subunit ScpB [Desulfobacterales bacterium]